MDDNNPRRVLAVGARIVLHTDTGPTPIFHDTTTGMTYQLRKTGLSHGGTELVVTAIIDEASGQ